MLIDEVAPRSHVRRSEGLHQLVGDLHLSYDVMELPADPGLALIAFSAEAGSPDDDALKLLVKLPPASLDAAYLLYPDPWPKTRHHKRRFISPTTLGELARVLKPGSTFRFASDIEDYANWALAHVVRSPDFRFSPERPGVWHEPYPGWQPTRYEEKARLEGRMISFYLEFQRL